MKKTTIKVNKDKHILHTIKVWNGYYNLTELEVNMLAAIVNHWLDLGDKIKDESLINKNFLDSEYKKVLMEQFSIKAPQLTTYLKGLISKKVLKHEEGTYYIDSKFIPTDKIIFEFKYE